MTGCTGNTFVMRHVADAVYLNANGINFAILGEGPHEDWPGASTEAGPPSSSLPVARPVGGTTAKGVTTLGF